MLGPAALLNKATFPRHLWVEIRVRVLPPPDLVRFVVASRHYVEISIAIDIGKRGARLDVKGISFDHITIPTAGSSTIPDHGGRSCSLSDDEIGQSIPVDVEHCGRGLFRSPIRRREIGVFARKAFPNDTGALLRIFQRSRCPSN